MHNDLWQSYRPNGVPKQGEGLTRKDLTKDTIVAAAHVWLWRRNSDGGCDVLLQRRADQVKNWPGYWDISAAGHVSLGETPLDAALREAQEEIGITLDVSRVKFIGSLPKRKSRIASFTLFTLMNITMSHSIWLMVKRRHCAGCRMTHSVR